MTKAWLVVSVAGAFLGCGKSVSGPPVTRVVVGVIEAGGTISGALSGPTTGVVGEPFSCTQSLQSLPRDVIVVFDRSGDVVLRLQGQALVGRNPAVITWPMQIRP